MVTISRVQLVVSDGVYTKRTPVAFVAADPIIVAANLFENNIISQVNETAIFDHSTSNLSYSLDVSEYCGPTVPLSTISELYDNNRIAVARITTDSIKEYTTIINTISGNLGDPAHDIVSRIIKLSEHSVANIKKYIHKYGVVCSSATYLQSFEKKLKNENCRLENDVKQQYAMIFASFLENFKI